MTGSSGAGPVTSGAGAGAGEAAIVGLGITEVGKVYGRTTADFARDAVRLAVADAGLALADVDGLLVSVGLSGGVGMELAVRLGLRDLRMLSVINAWGATAGAQIQLAAMAVSTGMAETVVCVHADAPLAEPGASAGAAYSGGAALRTGFGSAMAANGFAGANPMYALAARRHMEAYGTNDDHLAAVAVGQREWAAMNPLAQMRTPITVAEHHASRWVVEPFRLLDCCLVSNGAVAVVVTTAERSAHLRQPPVHLWGFGQGHPGYVLERGCELGLHTGAVSSGATAMRMAGITAADVDVCQLYDCYTYTVIVTLEDYGFCAKGEGGPFAASGALAPGGSLPTNTGGGQLSSFYLWGMTPVSEAVIQARGQAGERQIDRHDVVLVSGNGGTLDHHATLVLSPHRRS